MTFISYMYITFITTLKAVQIKNKVLSFVKIYSYQNLQGRCRRRMLLFGQF